MDVPYYKNVDNHYYHRVALKGDAFFTEVLPGAGFLALGDRNHYETGIKHWVHQQLPAMQKGGITDLFLEVPRELQYAIDNYVKTGDAKHLSIAGLKPEHREYYTEQRKTSANQIPFILERWKDMFDTAKACDVRVHFCDRMPTAQPTVVKLLAYLKTHGVGSTREMEELLDDSVPKDAAGLEKARKLKDPQVRATLNEMKAAVVRERFGNDGEVADFIAGVMKQYPKGKPALLFGDGHMQEQDDLNDHLKKHFGKGVYMTLDAGYAGSGEGYSIVKGRAANRDRSEFAGISDPPPYEAADFNVYVQVEPVARMLKQPALAGLPRAARGMIAVEATNFCASLKKLAAPLKYKKDDASLKALSALAACEQHLCDGKLDGLGKALDGVKEVLGRHPDFQKTRESAALLADYPSSLPKIFNPPAMGTFSAALKELAQDDIATLLATLQSKSSDPTVVAATKAVQQEVVKGDYPAAMKLIAAQGKYSSLRDVLPLLERLHAETTTPLAAECMAHTHVKDKPPLQQYNVLGYLRRSQSKLDEMETRMLAAIAKEKPDNAKTLEALVTGVKKECRACLMRGDYDGVEKQTQLLRKLDYGKFYDGEMGNFTRELKLLTQQDKAPAPAPVLPAPKKEEGKGKQPWF